MRVLAQVSPPDALGSAQGASLPFLRASLTRASAALSSLSANTGSTRCASLTVKAAPAGELEGPCLASGGNDESLLGELVVPSSACTEASYSALVRRRMRAGSESPEAVPAMLPPELEPAAAELPPDPPPEPAA